MNIWPREALTLLLWSVHSVGQRLGSLKPAIHFHVFSVYVVRKVNAHKWKDNKITDTPYTPPYVRATIS